MSNQLPISKSAEDAFIGAMINDPVLLDDIVITENDFYYQQNKDMFKCLMELKHNNHSIDLVGICEYFNNNIDYHVIDSLTNAGMISTNFKHWERIIINKSLCRRQIERAQQIIEQATQSEDASELFRIDFDSYHDGELVGMEEIMIDTMQHINDYVDGKIEDGIKSGIKPLDHFIGGFKGGNIYYLGARPSIGKTALGLQIVKNIAGNGKKIAFFSLEMGKRELGKRLLVNESRVHLNLIKTRKVESDEMQRMNKAASNLIKQNVVISDKGGQTVESILTKARRHKKKYGLDILFIDHFHILETAERGASANEKASYNSRMLKYISKELDIPVVCLVQLNRKLEERPIDKRMPIMSDIRDSGSLEQDADVIMFLNRQDYWHKDEPDYKPDNIADIKIAKNRDGETGQFRQMFYGGTQRFENI